MKNKKTTPIRIPKNIAEELELDMPGLSWPARITVIHKTHSDLKSINKFLFGKQNGKKKTK